MSRKKRLLSVIHNLIQIRENQSHHTSYSCYKHIAMIYSSLENPLAIGVNKMKIDDGYTSTGSIHAEHDAILKLKKLDKWMKVNLLVIRYTKGYELCNSKPCINCLNKMMVDAKKKGYHIDKIYYSNYCTFNGIQRNIKCSKLNTLIHEPDGHIPKFNRS